MIATKNISLARLIRWSWRSMLFLLLFSAAVATLYSFEIITIYLPWLAVSIIGTAVAFYVGFKNNSSYDRLWEARKIWGAIVNSSRAWGTYVDGFVSNLFAEHKHTDEQIHAIKKRLISWHIGWLYALRSQLLVVTTWEHANQRGHTGKRARFYQKKFGAGLVDDEVTRIELIGFLPKEEHNRLVEKVNTATQIINEQSRDLKALRRVGLIEDFRHMELMQLLCDFYEHQGKCERIKKFPLPRQYASMSRYFVNIFIFLLPFSLIP